MILLLASTGILLAIRSRCISNQQAEDSQKKTAAANKEEAEKVLRSSLLDNAYLFCIY